MNFQDQPSRSASPVEMTMIRKTHELMEIEGRRQRKTANGAGLH